MRIRALQYVLSSIWREPSNRGQRIRRVSLFLAWQLRKRISNSPMEAKLANGLRVQVWPDCDISPAALYYSLPNGKCISFLRRFLDGGTFLDIGANVGLVSLLVADKVQHAILFEPNPNAVERARENIRLNHLNFEVVAEALSDRVGTVEFENMGTVSACNRTVDGFTTTLPTITVQRTTLDRFLQDYRADLPAISAVKIDVEGHENSVLRGMKGFLRSQRPKLVMFEYLQRTDIHETLATFGDVGYSAFELTAAGPRHATSRVRPLQDLFACPTELAGQFGL
ncbi:MAG: FkbM family methyltransferase [Candidatus Sulfotelmatobacter sp.]